MTKTRRVFLTQLSVLSGSTVIGKPFLTGTKPFNHCNLLFPDDAFTVYHTNDLNGQITPLHKGLGGLAQFKHRLLAEGKKGLLFDAGGFMGDSRNAEGQTKLIGLMNAMGYQAAGVSSRELTGGPDNFAALAKAMRFKLVNCNHEFNGSLGGIIQPYTIVNYNGLKIGVTGVSTKLNGIKYANPIPCANRIAALLKKQEACDLVICLSQLGSSKQSKQVNDWTLAAQSEHIDVIIGSESGSTSGKTMALKNAANAEILLATAGRKCLTAGRLMFDFSKPGGKRFINSAQWVSGAPAGQHASVAVPNLEKIKDRLILV